MIVAFGVFSQGVYAEDAYMGGQELFNKEIPPIASIGPMAVANLNFNKQGNTIIARAGEKIFSTVNYSSDSTFIDADSLYQIVIGYESVGPQKCIFNELGYRFEGKEGILSFFCEAPDVPGVYEVQCRLSSARSSAEALQGWWDQKGTDYDTRANIGRIIVK